MIEGMQIRGPQAGHMASSGERSTEVDRVGDGSRRGPRVRSGPKRESFSAQNGSVSLRLYIAF